MLFSKDFLVQFSFLKKDCFIFPGIIFFFVVGTFNEASILVKVGCVTTINTAASTITSRSFATWLQLPSGPAVQIEYALKNSPTAFLC